MRPHRLQPTRLPRPWDSPGKNTVVGCHFLLQCMRVKSESEVAQSCPTLSDPMDCSPPGSSFHGIFQARVLEWVVIAFSDRKNWQPPIVTLDTGVGRVFRQIKGGIPPDSAFLFPTLVSIRETRWEWHGHQRALSSGSRLCLPSPLTHPVVLACSSHSRPLPAGGPTPQTPVPSLFSCFPQAGAPFLSHPSSKAQLIYTSSMVQPSQTSP